MNVTLTPEIEKRISEKIRSGEFDSAEAIVAQAVRFFLDYETDEMEESEFREVRSAVDEGLRQGENTAGLALGEFDTGMRAKYGIQR